MTLGFECIECISKTRRGQHAHNFTLRTTDTNYQLRASTTLSAMMEDSGIFKKRGTISLNNGLRRLVALRMRDALPALQDTSLGRRPSSHYKFPQILPQSDPISLHLSSSVMNFARQAEFLKKGGGPRTASTTPVQLQPTCAPSSKEEAKMRFEFAGKLVLALT